MMIELSFHRGFLSIIHVFLVIINHYFSRIESFIQGLKDYDIVVPSRVDQDGGFISHDIQHHSSKDKHMNFKIPVFNKQLHLELTKDSRFLSPGLIIETQTTQRQVNRSCHFTGRLKNQPGSTVFISTCRGLVSL